MSLFRKLVDKIAPNESGEMKKIREEAEKRRASRSSAGLPKVQGDVIDQTIAKLSQRVDSTSTKKD